MRRAMWVLGLLLLAGCGGSGTAAPTLTPAAGTITPVPSPTADSAAASIAAQATVTRGVEVLQLTASAATAAAPTATVAVSPTPLATPTMPPAPPVAPTDTPVPAVAPTPTFPILPTTSGGEVVTVLDDGTGQSVNIRIMPSMSARVVRQVRAGDDLPVSSTTPLNAEGFRWWQLVADHGGVNYVRADLVSTPHPPRPPTATPTLSPSNYAAVDPRDLAQAPDRYRGAKVCVLGQVFNVQETNATTFFQLYPLVPTSVSSGGGRDYPIAVTYAGSVLGLYKDALIVVWGTGNGWYSFTNVLGGPVSQSLIIADRMQLVSASNYADYPCRPTFR
jgi:hypothetical protein